MRLVVILGIVMYDGTMNTTIAASASTATVEFALAVINDVLDELSARLDAAGFPVFSADLERGIITT